MNADILTLILGLVALILGGSFCGIIAIFKLRTLQARLHAVEEELTLLRSHDPAVKMESAHPPSYDEKKSFPKGNCRL